MTWGGSVIVTREQVVAEVRAERDRCRRIVASWDARIRELEEAAATIARVEQLLGEKVGKRQREMSKIERLPRASLWVDETGQPRSDGVDGDSLNRHRQLAAEVAALQREHQDWVLAVQRLYHVRTSTVPKMMSERRWVDVQVLLGDARITRGMAGSQLEQAEDALKRAEGRT